VLIVETLRQQIGLIFVIGATGYALWRGGRPERVCGAAMLAAWLISPYVVARHDWVDPQWALAAIDFSLFALLFWYALRSDRYWPMWAAALLGLGVLMHITMVVDPRIIPKAYLTANVIWSYLVVLALVVGTAVEVRRPHRSGA
jgi:hypothetical protein